MARSAPLRFVERRPFRPQPEIKKLTLGGGHTAAIAGRRGHLPFRPEHAEPNRRNRSAPVAFAGSIPLKCRSRRVRIRNQHPQFTEKSVRMHSPTAQLRRFVALRQRTEVAAQHSRRPRMRLRLATSAFRSAATAPPAARSESPPGDGLPLSAKRLAMAPDGVLRANAVPADRRAGGRASGRRTGPRSPAV